MLLRSATVLRLPVLLLAVLRLPVLLLLLALLLLLPVRRCCCERSSPVSLSAAVRTMSRQSLPPEDGCWLPAAAFP